MFITKKDASFMLERGKDFIEIEPEMWAEILLYLSKRGWQPSTPSYWFLATDLNVSKDDAKGLAMAGQGVLDEALRDPLKIYPTPFDIGKLAKIVYFIEEGAFRICSDISRNSNKTD
jgi:hypothetical protein